MNTGVYRAKTMKGWELETMKEVWSNATGECIEVGPDRDGLGLIEIRHRPNVLGRIAQRFTMTDEVARRFHQQLGRWVRGELPATGQDQGPALPSMVIDDSDDHDYHISQDRADPELLEFSVRDLLDNAIARMVLPMEAAVLVYKALGELLGVVGGQ